MVAAFLDDAAPGGYIRQKKKKNGHGEWFCLFPKDTIDSIHYSDSTGKWTAKGESDKEQQ